MPHYTELNPETALAYAHALAGLYGLTVADTMPQLDDNEFTEVYEFRLSDDSLAAVWLESGRVYGEA